MPFKRFVEVGRVCLVNYGPEEGKLCVVVDIIDANRVLVDGPANITGVSRQVFPLARLSLTDLVCSFPRSARQRTVAKAFEKAEVLKKWDETAWAKKRALRLKRAKMTDFEAFKSMCERKKVAAAKNKKH